MLHFCFKSVMLFALIAETTHYLWQTYINQHWSRNRIKSCWLFIDRCPRRLSTVQARPGCSWLMSGPREMKRTKAWNQTLLCRDWSPPQHPGSNLLHSMGGAFFFQATRAQDPGKRWVCSTLCYITLTGLRIWLFRSLDLKSSEKQANFSSSSAHETD